MLLLTALIKLRKKTDHRILYSSFLDQASIKRIKYNFGGYFMKWETPAYTDLRFGFEVTMYIYNR